MSEERREAKDAYMAALKQQVFADEEAKRFDKPDYGRSISASQFNRSASEIGFDEKRLDPSRKQINLPYEQQYNQKIDDFISRGPSLNTNHPESSSRINDAYDIPLSRNPSSNWKREGYPSEYAHAQANGLLNIIPARDRQENIDRKGQQSVEQYAGGGALRGLGPQSNSSASPERKHFQPDYHQKQQQPSPHQRIQQREADRSDHSVDNATRGGITSIGNDVDKAAKKAKQAEYAKYLESQMHAREQRDNASKFSSSSIGGNSTSSNSAGAGMKNIGGLLDDKAAKREKQAGYARELQNQQQFHLNEKEQQKQMERDKKHVDRDEQFHLHQEKQLQESTERRYQELKILQLQRQQSAEKLFLEQHRYMPDRDLDRRDIDRDFERDIDRNVGSDLDRDIHRRDVGRDLIDRRNVDRDVDRRDVNRDIDRNVGRHIEKDTDRDPYSYRNISPDRNRNLPYDYDHPDISRDGDRDRDMSRDRERDREMSRDRERDRYVDEGRGRHEQSNWKGREAVGVLSSPSPLDAKKEEIAAKRAKQAEYALSLLTQQRFAEQQKKSNRNDFNNYGNDNNKNVSNAYESRPNNQNNRTNEAHNEKDLKRAKQAEYAQALQQQLHHQQAQSSKSKQKRSDRDRDRDRDPYSDGPALAPRLAGQNEAGGLEEGWVIGPLGQPVRRTLEVGHRGAQKAFTQSQNMKLSPTHRGRVEDYADQGIDTRSYEEEASPSYSPEDRRRQGETQGHYYDDDGYMSDNGQGDGGMGGGDGGRGGGSGGGGSGSVGGFREPVGVHKAHIVEPRTALNADVLDERKAKSKQMQSEQARALQQQMKDNAARIAAEKEKREREEMQEQTRLEVERVAMVKAFEQEQHAGRKKADDANKRALLTQAEEKRKSKEEEEQRELERERKDVRRVKEEQEIVRRKEMAELERERNNGKEGPGSHDNQAGRSGREDLFKRPTPAPSPKVSKGQPSISKDGYSEERGERQWQAPSRQMRPTEGNFAPSTPSSSSSKMHREDRNRDEDRFEKSMRGLSEKAPMRDDSDRGSPEKRPSSGGRGNAGGMGMPREHVGYVSESNRRFDDNSVRVESRSSGNRNSDIIRQLDEAKKGKYDRDPGLYIPLSLFSILCQYAYFRSIRLYFNTFILHFFITLSCY